MKITAWFLNLFKHKEEEPYKVSPQEGVPQKATPPQKAESQHSPLGGSASQSPMETSSVPKKEEKKVVLERYVVFKAGNIWLGIDIGEISEIVTEFSITPVPQVPHYVEGVMSLRGDMIPIVHLSRRLELGEKQRDEQTRVVVLKEPHVKVGFMVDEMREIVKVEQDLVMGIPKFISEIKVPHHFLKGVTLYNKKLLFILNAYEVLSKDTDKNLYKKMTGGHPERSEGSPRVNPVKKAAA
jgi:purine-binding chemotaxis protein CheW